MQLTLNPLEPTAKVVPAAGRPNPTYVENVAVPSAGIVINRDSPLLAFVGLYLDLTEVEAGFHYEGDEYTVESIDITQANQNIAIAATLQLTVTAEVGEEDPVTLRSTAVAYVSSHPARVTVSASGLCTGVSAGAAVITATKNGQTATVTLTVPA